VTNFRVPTKKQLDVGPSGCAQPFDAGPPGTQDDGSLAGGLHQNLCLYQVLRIRPLLEIGDPYLKTWVTKIMILFQDFEKTNRKEGGFKKGKERPAEFRGTR
jgi:hypothetical protein